MLKLMKILFIHLLLFFLKIPFLSLAANPPLTWTKGNLERSRVTRQERRLPSKKTVKKSPKNRKIE